MSLFSSLRNWTSPRSTRRDGLRIRPGAPRFRPQLEAMEERTLPSTYYAATATDLIADINSANKGGAVSTIVLTAPTTSPYALTAVNNTSNGANGLPVIKRGLTIQGNGDTIERNAAAAFRLFGVASGASLTLENVTLQDGLAFGSGSSAEGGAVYNQGTLVLDGATIQNNLAEGSNGANAKSVKQNGGTGQNAAGGGIWSSGSLTLENGTLLQYNTALGGQGGNAYSAVFNETSFGGTGGNASGGGIYVAAGTASLNGGTLFDNGAKAGYGGGGVFDPYASPPVYIDGGEAGTGYGAAWPWSAAVCPSRTALCSPTGPRVSTASVAGSTTTAGR
jgi:hypothetical protein